PVVNAWSPVGTMSTVHSGPGAVRFGNDQVLVVGGDDGSGATATAELYDPSMSTWSSTGSMSVAREGFTTTLLPNGKVLVAGGEDTSGRILASAELYQLNQGSACAADGDCEAHHCVDGVCCNTACGGGVAADCQACAHALTGQPDGTCAPVLDGSSCDDGNA